MQWDVCGWRIDHFLWTYLVFIPQSQSAIVCHDNTAGTQLIDTGDLLLRCSILYSSTLFKSCTNVN